MQIRKFVWLGMALAILSATAAKTDEFKEEETFFRVNIAGHVFRLEGLLVKRADATGPLPIALITHGKPANSQKMLDTHPKEYLGQARDMAKRGWLAAVVIRRGFGQSDGPMPAPTSCRSKSLVEHFSADADDLQATLDVLSQRPDADPRRVIALGVSDGGAAVLALAARNPLQLRGVVNISGGLRFLDCPKEEELVAAFKAFGTTSRVPSLWLYANNDSYFGPDLVQRMRNAFLDGGGDAKLVMFDPIGQDGHYLFSRRRALQMVTGNGRFSEGPRAADVAEAGRRCLDKAAQWTGAQPSLS